MLVKIENIGKVREANVVGDSITTIAGSNGTGKSTVGRVLVTFLNVMRQMDEFLIDKKLTYFFEELQRLLKLPESWRFIATSALSRAVGKGASLQPESWDTPDKVRKFLFEVTKADHDRFHLCTSCVVWRSQNCVSGMLLEDVSVL